MAKRYLRPFYICSSLRRHVNCRPPLCFNNFLYPHHRQFQSSVPALASAENSCDLQLHHDKAECTSNGSLYLDASSISPGNAPLTQSLTSSIHERTVIQSPVLRRKRAREKLHEKLPRKTDFDPLSRNPWARALASPVRMCSATHARLPKELLSCYGLVEHPQSEEPWMMPIDFLRDEMNSMALKVEQTTEVEKHSIEEVNIEGNESTVNQVPDDGTPADDPVQPKKKTSRFLKIRLANNTVLLSKLSKGKNVHVTRSLLPHRWKTPRGPLTNKDHEKVVWREDLPEFVLTHLRKSVIRAIKNCCNIGRDHRWSPLDLDPKSTLADGLTSALEKLGELKNMKCSAVLLLQASPENGNEDVSPVQELIDLPLHGTQIPLFNLPRLFSRDNLLELREHHDLFSRDAVLLRPSGNSTVQTILGLWKLQLYLTAGAS
ncbi:hypothetical protein LOZ65_003999 [Ophidiomyces ophidiicola]|nr:hypothetical protein LOZ65_003999 [Ophidiomyces ophidiicola]